MEANVALDLWKVVLLFLVVLLIVLWAAIARLHPFFTLLMASLLYGVLSVFSIGDIASSVKEGFGDTMGSVGIIIVYGTVIGKFLSSSGAAIKMARGILYVVGSANVAYAMSMVGMIVAIPVFADSAYLLLSPLNHALSMQAELSLSGTMIALATGLSSAHNLVPPTPGPTAAAAILEADLALVLGLGFSVALANACVGWLFAMFFANRTYIDPAKGYTGPQEQQNRLGRWPPTFMAYLPIIIPIILIALKSVAEVPSAPFGDGGWKTAVAFIGDPTVSLLIGCFLGLTLMPKFDTKIISTDGLIGEALKDAAVISMITAAGGSFGRVLQDAELGRIVGDSLVKAKLSIVIPILISMALKLAQGSGTIAVITTASIMKDLMLPLGFSGKFERAVVVVAIGSGASFGSHVNDSFFWILKQFEDLSVGTTLKLWTIASFVIGLNGAILAVVIFYNHIVGLSICAGVFVVVTLFALLRKCFLSYRTVPAGTPQVMTMLNSVE